MEGADSLADGSPSEYTLRRYVKDAEGGSAVIWFEAISIVPEGRSGRTQLYLCRENLDQYKRLPRPLNGSRAPGQRGLPPGWSCRPTIPAGTPTPTTSPLPSSPAATPTTKKFRAADDSCIVSDDYLKGLEEKFGEAAALAKEAGFDAVDIKACHGYLLAELNAAWLRPGPYGSSLENRTRLLRNAIAAAKVHEDASFMVTCRLGIYDGCPRPYGFGAAGGR